MALLVIAGLQSYYYGLRRGLIVSGVATAAYLLVVWPTLHGEEWANVIVRVAVLLGTALAVGLLAELEGNERLKVAALTDEARARERFIRSVVESLQEGVAALDDEGSVVAWNQALERCCGVRAGDLLGRPFFEAFPDAARAPWAEPLRQLLRGEVEHFTLDAVEHLTPHRGRVVLNLRGSLLRHGPGPAGAVLLVEDITERVALERSARQAEKLAGLGTLAAGVAHELNNPIGVLTSRIELMRLEAEGRPLPPELRDDLDVLHRHAQRVARISQGLLSFARQAPRERRRVDLNAVVEDTLLLAEPAVTKAGVRVERRLAPALPAVRGDANALQQVILNLLTNARDALGGAGDIVVQTGLAPDGRGLCLTIQDTGPGIPPHVLPRIFDPFFTTKTDGTGLGLSISYGIVRDHHGTVDVQTGEGRGTTFVLTFPAAPEDERV
jgi:PAS domain S-box-containing protein